jgi:macrolide transport system ATP-binding/permease protein
MNVFQRIHRYWQRIVRRASLDSELDAELKFHLECRSDDLQKSGLTPAQAARQARIELGMVEIHKDHVRHALGLGAIDLISIFWRTSMRSLRRHLWLATGAILILGFTVAINVALYAIFETYQRAAPTAVQRGELIELTMRQVDGRRARPLSDEELSSLAPTLYKLADAVLISKPIRMQSNTRSDTRMSTSYGVAANADYMTASANANALALGRNLAAQDDRTGAEPVIVLSFEGWQQLMGGRADVVGKSIGFGATTFTVVGVMKQNFVDFQPFPSHFWISNSGYASWRSQFLGSDKTYANDVGLIRTHNVAQARAQLLVAVNSLATRKGPEAISEVNFLPRQSLFSVEDQQDVQIASWPMFALVILVLVVACANLANLMLAKSLGQHSELAVRASIGASRARLVAQLCCDSALIALGGAVLGWLLGQLMANPLHQYLLSIMAETGLRPIEVRISFASWMYAFGLCWIAAFLFGLLPALSATSKQLQLGAKRDGALFGLAPSTLRNALTVTQVAASFFLLVSAFSLAKLSEQHQAQDLGYPSEQLIDLRHPWPTAKLRQLIEEIPGVQNTTMTRTTPLYGYVGNTNVVVDGNAMSLGVNSVDERYFETLGIALMHGRNFYRGETTMPIEARNSVVLSAATIKLLWPQAASQSSALGRSFDIVDDDQVRTRVTVVGIVKDVVSGMIYRGYDTSMIYLPVSLSTARLGEASDGIESSASTAPRAESDAPRDLIIAVQAGMQSDVIRQLSALCLQTASRQVCTPWSLAQIADRQQLIFKIAGSLGSALAISALGITLVGLFAVIRFHVANRTHEIGIRLAIGARHRTIIWMLLSDLWRQVRLGILLSFPMCIAVSYVIHNSFGLNALGLAQCYFAAIIGLGGSAYLAAWWPALAVRHISPKTAIA